MKWLVVFLFFGCCYAVPNNCETFKPDPPDPTLKLVFTLFQHGDTSPIYPPYPNDPYKNETYFPLGIGQLTNNGKEQTYEVGRYLRKKYDHFLGPEYYEGIVSSRTSDTPRTKTTMNMVQTGLFKPKGQNVWSKKYHVAHEYQPLIYNYLPTDNDPEILGIICPEMLRIFELSKSSVEYQNIYNKHLVVLDKLSVTGLPQPITLRAVRQMYKNLHSQELMGKTLPTWTQDVYPKALYDLVYDSYVIEQINIPLQKLVAGYLLKDILAQVNLLKNGNLPAGRKIYLYSGHDVTVAHLLHALGLFEDVPTSASFVIIEVHQNNQGVLYLKIFSQNYKSKNPKEVVIPQCGPNCSLTDFTNIIQGILPGPTDYCKVPAC